MVKHRTLTPEQDCKGSKKIPSARTATEHLHPRREQSTAGKKEVSMATHGNIDGHGQSTLYTPMEMSQPSLSLYT